MSQKEETPIQAPQDGSKVPPHAVESIQTPKAPNCTTYHKRPLKVAVNPSKPLKNRKHEAICRKLAKNPKLKEVEAYKEQYPNVSASALPAAASRLLKSVNVRERVMALLDKVNAGVPRATERLKDHMEQNDNLPVSMDAVKTVLRLSGALNEETGKEMSYNPVQINFIVHKGNAPEVSND